MIKCLYCDCMMVLAWDGTTPTGYLLKAYICPKCFSTHYEGNPNDPTFKMISEISRRFTQVWKRNR